MNSDLEKLKMYISDYRIRMRHRLYSGDSAIDLSQLENSIKDIVIKNSDNRDIVLEAVGVDGSFLQYASEELRRDRTIVTLAMSNNLDAAQFISDDDLLEQIKKDVNYDAHRKQR